MGFLDTLVDIVKAPLQIAGSVVGATGIPVVSDIGNAVSGMLDKKDTQQYGVDMTRWSYEQQEKMVQLQQQNNERNLELQHQYNMESQQAQNNWNLQMWNKQNDYNTPSAQYQRYLDAGLNPAYYLGQGGNASPSQASGANALGVGLPSAGLGSAGIAGNPGSSYIKDFVELAKLNSEIQVNEAKAGLDQSQRDTNEALREHVVKYQKALGELTEEQKHKVTSEVDKLKAEKDYIDAQRLFTDENKKLVEAQIDWLPIMNLNDLRKTEQDIRESMSRVGLNGAQRQYYKASLGLVQAQIQTEVHKQKNLDA